MLQALVLTFREGLGAFLVVGVLMSVVRRAGDGRLVAVIRAGSAVSVLTTAFAAALFSMAENQALWEGILAMCGAGCVLAIAAYVTRTTSESGLRLGPFAVAATLVITVVLITRGAMEIALLLGTMIALVPSAGVIVGTVVGTCGAMIVAWLWVRLTPRVPWRTFFQMTAIFLMMFLLLLLVDGIHEIAESNAIGGLARLHESTESFSSDGTYGQYAPFGLIIAPLAWWLAALFWGYGQASDDSIARMGR
jgi:high-affinity iron transporter